MRIMTDKYGQTWTDNDWKKCCRCKETLSVTGFGGKTKITDYCRECKRLVEKEHRKKINLNPEKREKRLKQNREAAARRYQRNRMLLDEYCVGKTCTDCPESDPIVFDFDHVRGKKQHQIGDMLGSHKWETILTEIEKCEIRCANCHRRKTTIQLGWRSKGGEAQ